jgi:aminoglycoside phosphotransferase (APT) family kinase protein
MCANIQNTLLLERSSMHLSEHVLQQRFLQQYQHTLPHKAHAEIVHFASLASGWESEIFALTLAYREGEMRKTTDLILKIVQGEQRRQKATLEYVHIKLLTRAGYPVPQLVQFSAKDTELGPYILMEYVRGQSLMEALQDTSDDAQRTALIQLFCSLLVQLHRLDWKPFVSDPDLYAQQDLLEVCLSTCEAPLRTHQISVFQPIFAWLRQRKPEIKEVYLAVNHLDFHSGNILLRNATTPVVIDWGNLAVNDLRLDLAWTCLLQADWREQILSEYRCMSGYQIEQFEFFEVIACLKGLITIFFFVRLQATDLGLRSGIEPDLRQQRTQLQQIYALLVNRTGIVIPEIEQIIEQL